MLCALPLAARAQEPAQPAEPTTATKARPQNSVMWPSQRKKIANASAAAGVPVLPQFGLAKGTTPGQDNRTIHTQPHHAATQRLGPATVPDVQERPDFSFDASRGAQLMKVANLCEPRAGNTAEMAHTDTPDFEAPAACPPPAQIESSPSDTSAPKAPQPAVSSTPSTADQVVTCQEPAEAGTVEILVFVGHVHGNQPTPVWLPQAGETLLSLTRRFERTCGVPSAKQKVLRVLSSPHLVDYDVESQINQFVVIPSYAVVLIELASDNDGEVILPLRPGRHLTSQGTNKLDMPKSQVIFEDQVRWRLTNLLNDRAAHNVSLDVISSMTTFSKSSLSMWRRHKYNGGNGCLCSAVVKALDMLEENGWWYEPERHDGSCAVKKHARRRDKKKSRRGSPKKSPSPSESEDANMTS